MTGEHFSSKTGKELEKTKDIYVRFRWEMKKRDKKPRQTILEKEKLLENKDLSAWIEQQLNKSRTTCVLCQQPEAWPLVRFEYYNWVGEKTESEVFAHEACLKTLQPKLASTIEGLRLMGKNPTFTPELNCLSADKCCFFNKGSDFRNCQHIVLRFDVIHENNGDGTVSVHMSPILYCKRAHPGEVFLETEDEDVWWNVEDAGLTLMAKRMTDRINTAQARAEIEAYKQKNPELMAEIKRLLALNPSFLSLLSPQLAFFAEMVLEPEATVYPLAVKENVVHTLAVVQ